MEDLTLITCSYNTPDVTLTMLKSFFKFHNETEVLVIDNSTNDETKLLLEKNNVPYFSNRGGLHIKSIDKLLKKVKTTYALLVDTDIVFLKDHTPIFNKFKAAELTLLGDVCGDRGGKEIHFRVHPWHCFMNVKNIRDNKITFFNKDKQFSSSDKIYDVGCTFYSDIKEKNLKIGDIKIEGSYYNHFEGMSWRTKRYGIQDGDIDFSETATHNNIDLYNDGIQMEVFYKPEINKHKDITIRCKPRRL